MKVLTKGQMEEIYRRNCDMVYRVCLLQLKHEQDALDAVSETFVRLFQKSPDFTDREHERAWLLRTAINYCKDVQKSFWKRKRNVYDEAAEQMLQSVQTTSEDRQVLHAIWKLPPAHAELLYLHYYEGYSIEELAAIMHKNASTLRSRLSRAKELLRKELEKDG
ncbi:RNA polymerase sigma factor [uncultured Eubacterium sp.]|uniref:RNA polymerase sigma factor n=1 Tax=uncultured Eubacterium sp. TaxID=165185 RepID=UPI0025D23A65|nr:RNA polymerase sigma factor [uncultured Eubacterium sp.]MCI6537442.1 RNA polymerase sigma factor [Lachnospiraceae bacterium]